MRIFNNYGPRAHYEGDCGEVIPRSIVRALYGKNPVIFGDGNVTRDFFYVKDTAKVLSRLIDKEGIKGKTYNLGTGVEITMKKLLTDLVQRLNIDSLSLDYLPDRPADVPRLWVDNTKIKEIVQLEGLKSFEQGLEDTIDYYRELMKGKDLIQDLEVINWRK